MKNFSKLVFSALFVLAVTPAFSQFSLGANLGVPSGDWSNFWGTGIGVDGRYDGDINDQLKWTATAGFMAYSGKTYSGIKVNSISSLSALGGIKYYFMEANAGLYGGIEGGFFSFSGNNNTETRFAVAPGVGYRLPNWDFSFRYNSISDFNLIGLRAAYVFGGSK